MALRTSMGVPDLAESSWHNSFKSQKRSPRTSPLLQESRPLLSSTIASMKVDVPMIPGRNISRKERETGLESRQESAAKQLRLHGEEKSAVVKNRHLLRRQEVSRPVETDYLVQNAIYVSLAARNRVSIRDMEHTDQARNWYLLE
eukprot:5072801-Karenia_brevis.AAC.1